MAKLLLSTAPGPRPGSMKSSTWSRPAGLRVAGRPPLPAGSAPFRLRYPSTRKAFRIEDEATATDVKPVPASHSPSGRVSSLAEAKSPAADLSFSCPICYTTEFPVASSGNNHSSHSCKRCSRTFNSTDEYVDLTLTSGIEYKSYQKDYWEATTTFQSPVMSFVYERGWRQTFAWYGFPGVDKEYETAMGYLSPGYGQTLLDMSCGSGLFTRKFAKSGKFSKVIAADFSDSMLAQTKAFVEEDKSIDPSALCLVRADVGRLPFASGTVKVVHAGAAIHCWPDPQLALAEISRVLQPGGVFVASTFLNFYAPLGEVFGDKMFWPLKNVEPNPIDAIYKYWEEDELKDLCGAVGLQDFRRVRDQRYIMFAVTKPKL